jgi:hypothetical protein
MANGPYMAVYDSMEWLPPHESGIAELVDYTKAVLDAVGMRNGAASASACSAPAPRSSCNASRHWCSLASRSGSYSQSDRRTFLEPSGCSGVVTIVSGSTVGAF